MRRRSASKIGSSAGTDSDTCPRARLPAFSPRRQLTYIQGNYDKADSLFLRAIGIQEKVLGADHSDLATYLGGRAHVLQTQVIFTSRHPSLVS